MTAPKPLLPADVVGQAVDLASIQFDVTVTAEQKQAAVRRVQDMATRKHTEDTMLIIGLAIGWATPPTPPRAVV